MIYNWAPLIYARTYEVDYRLIAVPEDFNLEGMKWAIRYILGTFETFTTVDGPNPLRWSVFKSHHHCVIGLTCMVYQLPTEKLQDKVGRRGLQVFLGYVMQRNRWNVLPTMMLPSMETESSLLQRSNRNDIPFCELYLLVEDHWDAKSWQASNVDFYSYEYELQSANLNYQATVSWHLNANPNETWVFRTKDNEFLWTIASQETNQISLCLGLSGKRVAQNGPFLNATTLDCDKRAGEGDVLYKPPMSPTSPPYSIAGSSAKRSVEGAAGIRRGGIKGFFGFGNSEPQQPDKPVTGNLYQSKRHQHDYPGRPGGKSEPKQGLPSGFRPKQPDQETEEKLPDPTAFEQSPERNTKLPPYFNERSTGGIPSGFRLKQKGGDTRETLPDPTADQSPEKSGTALPPTSKLKDVKPSQDSGSAQPHLSAQDLQSQFKDQKPSQDNEESAANTDDQPTKPLPYPENDEGNT